MILGGPDETTAAFEGYRDARKAEKYTLRLYVLGATQKSVEAIARTRAVCEELLAGRYDLKVIDLYQHPGVAARNGIIATPTLVKEAPAPLRRLIGNLSDSDSVLRALDVAA